jgi:hypothetical protein
MKTIQVHDAAIVLILTRKEALALQKRLAQDTGIKKTKIIEKVEEKLSVLYPGSFAWR